MGNRLATLRILTIAVIEKIQKLVEREEKAKVNQERQEILKRTYLSDRAPLSLRYSSKFLLNENNNNNLLFQIALACLSRLLKRLFN